MTRTEKREGRTPPAPGARSSEGPPPRRQRGLYPIEYASELGVSRRTTCPVSRSPEARLCDKP